MLVPPSLRAAVNSASYLMHNSRHRRIFNLTLATLTSSNQTLPAARVRQWLAHLFGRQRMSELGVLANQALVHLQPVRHQLLRASNPANVPRNIHDRSISAG